MENEIIHKHTSNPFKSWHLFAIVIPSFLFFFSIYHFSGKAEVKRAAMAVEKPTPEPKVIIQIGDAQIKAVKADTPEKRRIGLSNHTFLPKNEGMLFIFPNKDTRVFWMKDMDFAIDIIWLDEKSIFQIDENVQPEPEVQIDNNLRRYISNQKTDLVLEVNAGFVEENEIQVGDIVDIDPF